MILTAIGKAIVVAYLKHHPDVEWEKYGKI
jgi:hypothetical protein